MGGAGGAALLISWGLRRERGRGGKGPSWLLVLGLLGQGLWRGGSSQHGALWRHWDTPALHPDSAPPSSPPGGLGGPHAAARAGGDPERGLRDDILRKCALASPRAVVRVTASKTVNRAGGRARQHALTLFPCPGLHVHVRVCSRVCMARGVWAHGWGATSAYVEIMGKARVSAWAGEAQGRPAWHGSPAGACVVLLWPGRGDSHMCQHPHTVGFAGAGSPGLGEGSEEEPRSAPGLGPMAHTPVPHTAKTPHQKHACGRVQLRHGAREQDGRLSPPKSLPGVPAPPGGCRTGPRVPSLHPAA